MQNSVNKKSFLFFLITSNKHQIKKFGVKKLGVFGSFVRNEQNEQSDIDLLVDFEPEKETYKNFINLVFFLEDLFGRRVEIVTSNSLSPYIGPHILKEVEYASL